MWSRLIRSRSGVRLPSLGVRVHMCAGRRLSGARRAAVCAQKPNICAGWLVDSAFSDSHHSVWSCVLCVLRSLVPWHAMPVLAQVQCGCVRAAAAAAAARGWGPAQHAGWRCEGYGLECPTPCWAGHSQLCACASREVGCTELQAAVTYMNSSSQQTSGKGCGWTEQSGRVLPVPCLPPSERIHS